ncbi:MAG TPA: TetR/AcrR family transcriptional regulator [Lutibacter sp.]|nr:TetR/AcrR family transcriptional regulator [Lutibacter sp.]
MAIQKTSREEILKQSAKLFKIKGYYNTSMSDIANACGLLKGSIYHHFKSKDDIGLESLKYIHQYFKDEIFSIANNNTLNTLEKIKLLVRRTDNYFLNSEGGCLLGNLALEVSWSNIEFKNEIKDYFLNWEETLYKIYKEKYSDKKAQELSKEFVALIQGEIMMMNLHNDKDRYLKVGEKMIKLLE